MKRYALLLSSALAGCSTIHFTNGPQVEDTVVREQWHHITLNDLVEVSPPMDLNYNCANQEWDTVTIERTFVNGFVGAFTQVFQGLSIYSPWTIRYQCREPLVPFIDEYEVEPTQQSDVRNKVEIKVEDVSGSETEPN